MDKVNRCPICQGWMILDRNSNGWHIACLHCRFYRDLDNNEIIVYRENNQIWERVQFQNILMPV
jgi:hypothetical protein